MDLPENIVDQDDWDIEVSLSPLLAPAGSPWSSRCPSPVLDLDEAPARPHNLSQPITYALGGHDLNIAIVFVRFDVSSAFSLSRSALHHPRTLIFIPFVLFALSNTIVSFGHIGTFLAAEELADLYAIELKEKNAVNVDASFAIFVAQLTLGPKKSLAEANSDTRHCLHRLTSSESTLFSPFNFWDQLPSTIILIIPVVSHSCYYSSDTTTIPTITTVMPGDFSEVTGATTTWIRLSVLTRHAAWASCIRTPPALADDTSGAMIYEIRDGMPPLMKKIVTGTCKTYKDFCDVVKTVDEDAIALLLADERRFDDVEAATRRLSKDLGNAHVWASASVVGLRGCNANVNAGPFAGGAMRGGNIFHVFHLGGVRGGAVVFCANHRRMTDLTRNSMGMLQHPNTAGIAHAWAIVDAGETHYRRIIREDRAAARRYPKQQVSLCRCLLKARPQLPTTPELVA
ncbi:hypothetical protein B0H12DRAFT_1245529 [Mycena haematopus]|nr:hypothetical protein B0H12DRAFT_1245529 [Mycena haematopus]